MIRQPELLPLGNTKSEVLELAFPFAETGLQQYATFPTQLATIEGKIAQAGKEGHCAPGDEFNCNWEDHVRHIARRINSWLYATPQMVLSHCADATFDAQVPQSNPDYSGIESSGRATGIT